MEHTVSNEKSFELPEEIQMVVETARRVVRDELMPLEQEYLASPNGAYGVKETVNVKNVFSKEVADHLIDVSKRAGLWDLMIPESHGGGGLSMLGQVAVMEQLYYTAVPLPVAAVPNILYYCKGDQVERYLKPVMEGGMTTCFAQSEPNAGSDPGGMMKTTAVQDGDEWVINGTKMWISMAHESDIIMVQAVTDATKRQRGGITMFLVKRSNPGVKIEEAGIRTWLGPKPAQYVVHFENCRVSSKDVLGEVGQGFVMGQKWLAVHDRLLRGPYALGKMQRALDMSIEWAKQRQTFGKPIAERQYVQGHLVEMYAEIEMLRSLTYKMAAVCDTGADIRAEAALIKWLSTTRGAEVLDKAIQIHGAMGETLELPLTLFYRYLRHAQIGGGTNEMQKMLIARKLLGKS